MLAGAGAVIVTAVAAHMAIRPAHRFVTAAVLALLAGKAELLRVVRADAACLIAVLRQHLGL